MKKIILISLVFLSVCIYGQNVKPLKGFYAKITLQNGDSIITEDNVLKPKTYPTTWYFAEIDTNMTFNVVKVGNDQTIKIKFGFRVYYDYWNYWNFYNPIRLYWTQTHYESGWIDIIDGFMFETQLPAIIKTGIATKLNLPESRLQILSY